MIQKYQANEENSFDCSQEANIKNTENSHASNNYDEKRMTPSKNNFKSNIKQEKPKSKNTAVYYKNI